VCQRSSNHKLKAIHNYRAVNTFAVKGVSKIVKSQIESNSQREPHRWPAHHRCVKDRQITNWKQFTTACSYNSMQCSVCQRSSNHKLKAIHNGAVLTLVVHRGVSKIVKSQIESNSQLNAVKVSDGPWCVKDRQITNWKQFTTGFQDPDALVRVCQRSSNHKLKAIHNSVSSVLSAIGGVSKIVKSQIESNSQLPAFNYILYFGCVKDRQITNWKQFTTHLDWRKLLKRVCQRSSNHKLKAIHNRLPELPVVAVGVSKIVKSQIESNSQQEERNARRAEWCVKDRQITNWKQFTTLFAWIIFGSMVCQRSSNHKLKAIHNWRTF